jgi:hypothetical protein
VQWLRSSYKLTKNLIFWKPALNGAGLADVSNALISRASRRRSKWHPPSFPREQRWSQRMGLLLIRISDTSSSIAPELTVTRSRHVLHIGGECPTVSRRSKWDGAEGGLKSVARDVTE